MSNPILKLLSVSLLLSACAQAPVFKDGEHAHIQSNYPITNVNGEKIEPAYTLDLKAGENTLIIVYHTYRYNFYCSFTWIGEAGSAYEVTDQEQRFPLTLYRLVPSNSLWSSRLDPIDPTHCPTEQALPNG